MYGEIEEMFLLWWWCEFGAADEECRIFDRLGKRVCETKGEYVKDLGGFGLDTGTNPASNIIRFR